MTNMNPTPGEQPQPANTQPAQPAPYVPYYGQGQPPQPAQPPYMQQPPYVQQNPYPVPPYGATPKLAPKKRTMVFGWIAGGLAALALLNSLLDLFRYGTEGISSGTFFGLLAVIFAIISLAKKEKPTAIPLTALVLGGLQLISFLFWFLYLMLQIFQIAVGPGY